MMHQKIYGPGESEYKMIFFISILIVAILYFLQADGLIYVTIIALIGELINILMIHTMTKSIEKKEQDRSRQVIEKFQIKIKEQNKTIKDLEKVRDESVRKLFNANKKIQEFEEQFKEEGQEEESLTEKKKSPEVSPEPEIQPEEAESEKKPDDSQAQKQNGKKSKKDFDDLPSGSNRKKRQI